MNDIKEILLELTSVQSDTGTPMEALLGHKIHRTIHEHPYFTEFPEYCGIETDDIMQRPLVWALRRGRSDKTIILSGHYDAVEIDCYGGLKECALRPDRLKARMLELGLGDERVKKDLRDGDWLFGRGVADMKAGVAINLHALFTLEDPEPNILFTAVCDEENVSAGCRAMMPLLLRLKERFGLDYRVCLITEPQITAVEEGAFTVYGGGTGKILPTILAKGKLAHCAQNVEGLNAAGMIAEIARNIDLNPDLMTEDLGMATQPPAVQIMKDLKTTYDVSLPEYAVAGVNILFLGEGAAPDILAKIRAICEASFRTVVERYDRAFDAARDRGLVREESRLPLRPLVLSLKELEEHARRARPDFESIRERLVHELSRSVLLGERTLQAAGVAYMQEMARCSLIEEPFVTVGLVPPYYPAISNNHLDKKTDGFLRSMAAEAARHGLKLTAQPYLPGMADISYMSCTDPQAEKSVMENMAVPDSLYAIPFDAIATLNIPAYCLGPRCRDCHQWTERVYMPDVERVVPDIIRRIVREL